MHDCRNATLYAYADLAQLLYAAGFLFMGATEEQMNLVAHSGLDGVSYILIMYSLAFLLFLFVNMLIHLYDRLANPALDTKDFANGHARVGGRAVEEGRLREAEEFELSGLMSDDEGDETQGMLRRSEERGSLDTPSTLGKNNHTST